MVKPKFKISFCGAVAIENELLATAFPNEFGLDFKIIESHNFSSFTFRLKLRGMSSSEAKSSIFEGLNSTELLIDFGIDVSSLRLIFLGTG